MSPPPKPDIFLERASYRQRRLRDAARLLPVLGLILWTIPLLWPDAEGADRFSAMAVSYIFGVWVSLIVLAAVISHVMRPDDDAMPSEDDDS